MAQHIPLHHIIRNTFRCAPPEGVCSERGRRRARGSPHRYRVDAHRLDSPLLVACPPLRRSPVRSSRGCRARERPAQTSATSPTVSLPASLRAARRGRLLEVREAGSLKGSRKLAEGAAGDYGKPTILYVVQRHSPVVGSICFAVQRVFRPPGAFDGMALVSRGPPIGGTPASPERTGGECPKDRSGRPVIAQAKTTTETTATIVQITTLPDPDPGVPLARLTADP